MPATGWRVWEKGGVMITRAAGLRGHVAGNGIARGAAAEQRGRAAEGRVKP